MKPDVLSFSSLLVFVFIPFSILSQVNDTVTLKEVSIQKKRNIKEIIKNITKNIDKNYPKAVNHLLDINQISIRGADTVIAFNGSINYIMPNYNQRYSGKTISSLCQSHSRTINKKGFAEWYPPKKSKSSKYE